MRDNLSKIYDFLAPGKELRKGIDIINEANLGGLIFLASRPEEYLENGLIQLGFKIDTEYEPQKLYELAKMDGAIVMDKEATRILYANTQLVPNGSIPTSETGTRHRTAEKIAVQTGDMTIAISKRRSSVSVFYKKEKYELQPETTLFARLNQEITIAQRYKQAFIQLVEDLNIDEVNGTVKLYDISEAISKGLLTLKISERTEKFLKELGDLAGSARLEYNEILTAVPKLLGILIMDYSVEFLNLPHLEDHIKLFEDLTVSELLDLTNIANCLGYDVISDDDLREKIVMPRGYRLLYSTRLPANVIRNVVEYFDHIEKLLEATYEELTNIPGVGRSRGMVILRAIKKRNNERVFEGGIEW